MHPRPSAETSSSDPSFLVFIVIAPSSSLGDHRDLRPRYDCVLRRCDAVGLPARRCPTGVVHLGRRRSSSNLLEPRMRAARLLALSFVVALSTVFAVNPAEAAAPGYVALGDSYSSGLG